MTAYATFDIAISDPERYEEHKKRDPPTIAAFGGKYRTRGGKTEVLEGRWAPTRLVILEFPCAERAKAWLDSPEYRAARSVRHSTATTNAVLVEGL